jgi:plasmid stabilization system protein ParE
MTVRWTRRAVRDLIQIHLHIEADDPDAANRWIRKLHDRAVSAARMPMSGRLVREFQRSDLREVLVKRYRIIYRVDGRDLVVVTVMEGHKLVPDDLDPDEE